MPNIENLYTAMEAFASQVKLWDGEEEQAQAFAQMAGYLLSPDTRAQLIFQLLTAGHGSETEMTLNTAGKQFAVVMAETMGPDWAQWLYNFTKVVTKLA